MAAHHLVVSAYVSAQRGDAARALVGCTVFCGTDAAAGWIVAVLRSLGMGLSGAAWIAVAVAADWSAAGGVLGRRADRATEPERLADPRMEIA
jgi:hypothetical protein